MHKKTSNGEHEIRLRLTLYKDVTYLSTGFTSSLTNWDNDNDCPKSSHPKFKTIIKKIQDLIDEVNFEVKLNLKNGIDVFSLSELKNKIKTPIKKSNKIKIIDFYKSHILQLETDGRIGYANVFRSSMLNFKRSTNNTINPLLLFRRLISRTMKNFF